MLPGIAILALITFSSPPQRLERLIPFLGKSMGRDLQVGPELGNEVGIVEVSDVGPADLLKRVAATFGGEWEEDGATLRLRRPNGLQKRLADEAADLWTSRLLAALPSAKAAGDREAKAYVRRVKALQRSQPGEDENERLRTLWYDLPTQTLGLPTLVRGLPLRSLVSIYGRTVFSDAPTAMQRGLARSVLLPTYRAHDAILNAALADPFDPGEDPTGADAKRWFGGADASAKRAVLGFARAGGKAKVDLRLFAADGRTLRAERIDYELTFGRSDLPDDVRRLLGKPLALAPEGARWLAMWRRFLTARGASTPMTDEERTMALDPVDHEPLARSPIDGLRGIAREAGRDLVALVSDDDPTQNMSMEEKPTYGSLVDVLLGDGARFEESEGWLLVRPIDAESVRQARIDRKALGRWLRSMAVRYLTFDEAAQMARDTIPSGFDGSALGSDLTFLLSRQRLGIWNEPELVGAYGALAPSERRRLADGEAIPWSRLSGGARRALERALFRRPAALWAGDREPTDVFPQGLPGNLLLSADVEDAPQLLLEPWAPGTDEILARSDRIDGFALTNFLRQGFATPLARPAVNRVVTLVLTVPGFQAKAPLGVVLWADVAKPARPIAAIPKAHLQAMLADGQKRFTLGPERWAPLQRLIDAAK